MLAADCHLISKNFMTSTRMDELRKQLDSLQAQFAGMALHRPLRSKHPLRQTLRNDAHASARQTNKHNGSLHNLPKLRRPAAMRQPARLRDIARDCVSLAAPNSQGLERKKGGLLCNKQTLFNPVISFASFI
jgi:hypothetical protein